MEAGTEAEKPAPKVDDDAVKEEKNGAKVDENNGKNDESTKEVEKEEEKSPAKDPIDDKMMGKIKDQVEFYFGDVNMQNDKFLTEQMKLDEGWIPMNVLMTFKMLNNMCSCPETVLKAVEKSELMEISEDRQKLRRRLDKPLPVYDEQYKKAQIARTVYVKGFPQKDIDINTLKEFFKDFGTVENIIMRKYKEMENNQKVMKFKGSIFVQFKTLDDAKAFVDKESVKYKDFDLIKMFSKEHSEKKAAEKEEIKKLKKSKQANKTPEEVKAKADKKELKLPKGALLRFSAKKGDDVSWDLVKTKIMGMTNQKPAYVEYDAEKAEGFVRFAEENAATPFLELIKTKSFVINDVELKFEIVEGEEEEKFLAKALENVKSDKKPRFGKGKKGKKRSTSPSPNDESSAKKRK